MQANEVRYGNWVSHNGKPLRIISIDATMQGELLAVMENGEDFYRMSFPHDGKLEPIPLSPELLEKIGFEEDTVWPEMYGGRRWNKVIGNRDIAIEMPGEGYNVRMWPLEEPIECPYLHQLQNLHFALTGQELEIDL